MQTYQKVAQIADAIANKHKMPYGIVSFRDVDGECCLNEGKDDLVSIHFANDNSKQSLHQLESHRPTIDDHTHLFRYAAASTPLNRALVKAHSSGVTPPDMLHINDDYANISHDLHGLDAAIGRHQLKDKLVTYSGVSWNPSEKQSDSGMVHLPAYSSTTIDPGTAIHFARKGAVAKEKIDAHILRIHHKPGDTGVYTNNNPDLTPHSTESEFIMPRGSVIRLVNKKPEKFTQDGLTYHVWDAERVHSPKADTSYVTPHGADTVFQKGRMKLVKTDNLAALKKHYPEFAKSTLPYDFHESHVRGPVYHLHMDNGMVYQGLKQGNGDYEFSPANKSISIPSDAVVSRFPELEQFLK